MGEEGAATLRDGPTEPDWDVPATPPEYVEAGPADDEDERPGAWTRLRERWADRRERWTRRWRKATAGPRKRWRRRRARWRAWLADHVPGWALWATVLAAWTLLTWATMDAVPARWESVTWKASAGLFAAGLVGRRMWAKLLGYGVYLLRELEPEVEEERRRRRRERR